MQIRQTNHKFNFGSYPTFGHNIDPKQRAWIEVRGKALETNVRQLRSKLSKNTELWQLLKQMDMDMMQN